MAMKTGRRSDGQSHQATCRTWLRVGAAGIAVLAVALVSAGGQAGDLDAVKALIGEIKVRIEHKEERTAAKDNLPPRKSDSWKFKAGGVNPTVRYGRFLNRPPEFTGNYPSLANSDMGIGLDSGPLQFWYSGNAIRVVLDGRDIFAERPASRIETRQRVNGHLRLIWELERKRRVALNFAVPRDGRAVFARIDIEPGEMAIGRTEVRLTAYPGGFGPAYRLPSHRYVKTAGAAADVPPDFKVTAEHPFPVLPLSERDDWVFYGDKLSSPGSLALLVNRAEKPTGQVQLSSYGVSTSLVYPASVRQIHLAFFAYSIENEPAQKALLTDLNAERTALTTIPFWTE
jgi:hypothetical protein